MKETVASIYKRIIQHPFILLFAACVLSVFLFDYSADKYTPFFIVFFCVSTALLIFLAVYWRIKGTLTEGKIVFLITAFSFLIKLAYVIYTGLKVRQHDIGSFKEGSKSHAGYIYHIYTTNDLPDTFGGQYYHPPFHYILEAYWLKALTFLGFAFEKAQHYVTALTLFYSAAAGLISYRIFKEFHFNKTASTVCYALVALHPAFIIHAASYNNDCLSITLMLLALLFLIRWWKEPTFFNIIMVAIGIGYGMMTKLSAAYIAPAAAVLFLVKFISEKQKLKKIGEFAAFGAICIPAGTWWSIWIHEKFGARFGYVMQLGKNHDQYVGFRSVWERLCDSTGSLSEGIYFARGEKLGNAFHEYNIPGAILKTSVFGEWHMGEGFTVTEILARALFIVNILVVAISLFCMVYALFKKFENVPRALKFSLYILYVTIMGTFVNFCFTHAHDCTMDFRYIVPTVVIGSIFIGIFLTSETKSRFVLYIKRGVVGAAVIFCVCSSLLYLLSNYAAN